MKTVSENRCFGGVQGVYTHASDTTGCDMTFGLFLPEEAERGPVPVIWYLSGLTCTHENAMVKAGAQKWAAEAGVALVFPDTSPRGADVPNDEAYDLGQGAGFYVNATEKPWSTHFRMWDYVTEELPRILFNAFPVAEERQSITGHSMGGHGALVMALKNPGRFVSVSAFAPIVNPTQVPWGKKAFTAYLGADEAAWQAWDSCALMQASSESDAIPTLIDQGDSDAFLAEQLQPAVLAETARQKSWPLTLRIQPGYDHSYYFIASFIEDHLRFHARHLFS